MRIELQMELWDQIRFATLVDDTINGKRGEEEDPERADLRQNDRSVQIRPITTPYCLDKSDRRRR